MNRDNLLMTLRLSQFLARRALNPQGDVGLGVRPRDTRRDLGM